jgi:CRISPR-associated endonuclease/helicase Cas3
MGFIKNIMIITAISECEKKYKSYDNKELIVLREIVALAGFFHDLGKGVSGFQSKLNSAKNKENFNDDIVRHELISTILLSGIVLGDKTINDLNTSKKVKDYFNNNGIKYLNEFKNNLFHYIKDQSYNFKDIDKNINILESIFSINNWKSKGLECSLLWLVLTHHKMPMGVVDTYSIKNGKRSFIEKKYSKNKYSYQYFNIKEGDLNKINKQFFDIDKNKMPWNSSKWCSQVAKHVKNIIKIKEKLTSLDLFANEGFINNLTIKARTALIYSDYIESINKNKCNIQDHGLLIYANTYVDDNNIYWGDTLVDHLSKVGNTSYNYFDKLFLRDNDYIRNLPYIKENKRPITLENPKELPKSSPFYWQNAIVDKLKKERNNIHGFFGIVCSKTGSGKTRACPAIMNSISQNLRFTLALGMRSLTTQSYKSYLSELIGFKKEDVSLLIGNNSIEKMESDIDKNGSASIDDDNDILEVTATESDYDSELLDMYSKSKEIDLITSPVSVMTVDHIIKATSTKKGVDHKIILHLMNTDLILDEIDDYDAKDLISISKIIYLSGFFGRKVIVSSATTSPSIIKNLMASYSNGYKEYINNTDDNNPPVFAFMSHLEPFVNYSYSNDINKVCNEYNFFIENYVEKIKKEPVNHKAKSVNIHSANKKNFDFNILDSECLNFHKNNHEIVPNIDCEISFGFVRFNNVINAQKYAMHLSKTENFKNYDVKIICYHSKMLIINKNITENFLNNVLNRNDKNPWEHSAIKKDVKNVKNNNKKGIIYIVSTTSIQETGRDHDYDWIICEPISNKSIVQCSGRVWRHRRHKIAIHPNVGIMNMTLKGYQGSYRAWAFPGIETDSINNDLLRPEYQVDSNYNENICNKLKYHSIEYNKDVKNNNIKNILSNRFFNKKIDAIPTITKPLKFNSDVIGTLEYIRNFDYIGLLNSEDNNNESIIGNYINRSDYKLNSLHWDSNSFRKKEKNKININIFQKNLFKNVFSNFNWKILTERNSALTFNIKEKKIDNDDRFVLMFNLEDEIIEMSKILNKENSKSFAEVIVSINLSIFKNETSIYYNHHLGFCKF